MSEKTKARGRPKNFYDRSAKNTIQSVDRAFNVLELLAAKGGMTLSEVAAELDQSAATIYRVLSTLQAREVVEPMRSRKFGILARLLFKSVMLFCAEAVLWNAAALLCVN